MGREAVRVAAERVVAEKVGDLAEAREAAKVVVTVVGMVVVGMVVVGMAVGMAVAEMTAAMVVVEMAAAMGVVVVAAGTLGGVQLCVQLWVCIATHPVAHAVGGGHTN